MGIPVSENTSNSERVTNEKQDSLAAKTAPNAPAIKGSKKKLITLFILAIVFAGLGGAVYGLLQGDSNKENPEKANVSTSCTPMTDEALVLEANTGIIGLDYNILLPVVEKIQAIKCYNQNSTYVYIALMAAISVSDSTDAEKYLAQIEKIYDPLKGYSEQLAGSEAPTVLKSRVEVIKEFMPTDNIPLLGVPSDN